MKKLLFALFAVLASIASATDNYNINDRSYAPNTAGTSGYVWTSNGAGTVPSWQAAGGGGGMSIGGTVTSGNAQSVLFVGAGPVLSQSTGFTYAGAAGKGLYIAAGTAASAVDALNITQTWNDNASIQNAIAVDVTRSSYSSVSNLISLKADGNMVLGLRSGGTMDFVGNRINFGGSFGSPYFYFYSDANNTAYIVANDKAVAFQAGDAPTCSTNCGTSPSVAGTDTASTVTMGATGSPASGWVLTFNSTWAAAPHCTVQMAKAGMVVGKMALTAVTTQTTMTVVTNGTAPANGDMYHVVCVGHKSI